MNDLVQFKVRDLYEIDSDFTFILESPHKQEIIDGYPAAGETGLAMSKALFNLDEPLGKLIVKKSNNIPLISLMNCSRLPLKKSCYDQVMLSLGYTDFLEIQKVTDSSLDIHKGKIKDKLRSRIGLKAVNCFRSRLLENIIKRGNTKIIVCGVIAQCFFEEATKLQCYLRKPTMVNWEGYTFSVFYEYHPSPKSGQWQNSTNMVSLLKFISPQSVKVATKN